MKTNILLGIVIALVCFAIIKAAATERQESDYCWFDSVSENIECLTRAEIQTYYDYKGIQMVTELQRQLDLQNLSPKDKEIHTQRLLIKAENNLKLRRRLHHRVAVASIEYDDIEKELKAMGKHARLKSLEKMVISHD